MRVWDFLKETFGDWSEDRAPRMGAALAYYTTFSLAPVLVIAIGVAGIFFGQRMAEGRLMDEIRGLVGPEGAFGEGGTGSAPPSAATRGTSFGKSLLDREANSAISRSA